MFKSIAKKILGTKHEREMKRLQPFVDEINRYFESYRDLSEEELKGKTEEFRSRLKEGESLDDIMPEAFATVKEACRRLLGQKINVTGQEFEWDMVPFDVQLIGGIVLHQGKIAEMATGEGKTLVATMPLYLNALEGKGAHLVTVNDYLAQRDSEWMGTIFKYLGLKVGCIQHAMMPAERREIYNCDITYGTNNEFGFDYLRDNMSLALEERVQRGHHYTIIDEVDSVLIDEARTPLIISGPVGESNTKRYSELKPLVENLTRAQKQQVNSILAEAEGELEGGDEYEGGIKLLQASRGMPKNKKLLKILKEQGMKKLLQRVEADYMREKRLHVLDEDLYFSMDEKGHNINLSDKGRERLSPRDKELFVIPDLSEKFHKIDTNDSLSAEEKWKRKAELEKDYGEKSEKIHIISQLLKAFVLFEKDVEYVLQEGKVLIVDEFTGRLMPGRRYSDGLHQAIEAKEGVRVEGETQTLATITLQNFFRLYDKLAGMTGTAETEENEFFEIYKLEVIVIPSNRPVRRIDYDDVIYRSRREKYNAIIDEIEAEYKKGRPILVGTVTVDVSETLSRMLKRRGIKHHVLNAKHHQKEAEIVTRAGQPGAVTIATNMAGRGTDIKLGPGVVRCSGCVLQYDQDHVKVDSPGDNIPEGESEFYCLDNMPCGLHIIGTERHESRRIDRQLRGRSARQGDPGSSRFFLSLEDDLMRLFGSDRIAGVMDKLGAEEGEPIVHSLVTRSIERAQKKVEAHNFEIRKHLLEYDDVMNQQREVIYDQRLFALEGHDLEGQIRDMVKDATENRIDQYVDSAAYPDEWDLKGLSEDLRAKYLLDFPVSDFDINDLTHQYLQESVWETASSAFQERLETLEEAYRGPILQRILLHVLDDRWKEHLHDVDHLKSGISFRAYAQKDPLIEYKQEAYRMFVELLDEIKNQVTSFFFRARFVPQERVASRDVSSGGKVEARHAAPVSAYTGAGAAPEQKIQRTSAGHGEGSRKPIVKGEKVGRNDPCPCGSGVKYKKCCGK
jgi:preprotein translocase subunit SecA